MDVNFLFESLLLIIVGSLVVLWYARPAEFMQQPVMETLKWFRFIDDTIFVFGTVALAWFIFVLKGGWSIEKNR